MTTRRKITDADRERLIQTTLHFIESHKGEPRCDIYRAELLFFQGREQEAESFLRQIAETREDPRLRASARLRIAYLRDLVGDEDGAVEAFREAMIEPAARAEAAWMQARIKEASEASEDALQLTKLHSLHYPKISTKRRQSGSFLTMLSSLSAMEGGDALALLRRFASEHPKMAHVQTLLGTWSRRGVPG